MALVLLIGAGLLMRSFLALRAVDPGYDTRDVFTFQFAPEQPALKDGPSWARFHLDFLDRLAALPGVTSVGLVENVPLDEGTRGDRFRSEDMPDGPDAGGRSTSRARPATTSARWRSTCWTAGRSRPRTTSPRSATW